MSDYLVVKLIGTTAADGSLTLTSEASYNAELSMVQWVDGDLADGVDAVLSVTNTDAGVDYVALTLTNANDDALYLTRHPTSDAAGAALLYATGEPAVSTCLPVVGRLKLVIADGGNAKTGGAVVFLEG